MQKLEDKDGDSMSDDDDESEDEKDLDMEEDDGEISDNLVEFKTTIVDILKDNKLVTKRSAKMDITDFLQLLSLFNKSGIHFR